MNQKFFTMPDTARIVGQTYNRVRWAILNRVVDPAQQYGQVHRVRLFTPEQVEELRKHFSRKGQP
jgi:hypothetical protein